MSEREWTPAQRQAISHRGGDLLVSASAGSGKTATLTARLIELLCSPSSDAEVSEVLAVTFTNAASAEMRSRLFSAASEEVAKDPSNARARRLLSSIDQVQICTMHAFCLTAIRPYFSELGLASDFRLADDTESALLRERAIGDTVSRLFDNKESADELSILADTLASPRDEASLDQTLLGVFTSLEARGVDSAALLAYATQLEKWAEDDPFSTPFGDVLREKLVSLAGHYERVFSHYTSLLSGEEQVEKYVPECERLSDICRALRRLAGQTFPQARECLNSVDFPRLVTVKSEFQTDESLEFKAHRDAFKKELKVIRDSFFVFGNDEVRTSLSRTAALNRALSHVAASYEARYAELKRERGAVDFSDLERFAHRLFVGKDGAPTAAALRCAQKYRYVFIDEYQDTNRIQDDIFRAISVNAERFMVGDVKQSIYAFRGAEPDVFTSLRREYMAENGGKYIHMSENFRCASNVIRYTNAVSRMMFCHSDTPFDETDELIYARGGADCVENSELVLLSKDDEERSDNGDGDISASGQIRLSDPAAPGESIHSADVPGETQAALTEAQYVARRIRELIANGKKSDGTPITPGDIAILIRSANQRARGFADELEALGIPVSLEAKRDFFADPTVLTVICLLHAVASPELDIYFTGALKSAPFGFSLDDAVRIRIAYPSMPMCASLEKYAEYENDDELTQKCRRANELLASLRCYASLVPPDAFIRYMSRSLELESTLDAPCRADVRRKLRELRTLARDAQKSGFTTLDTFLSFLDRMMEKGAATESASAGDAVSIMSVHHAKGLEFPVCFLACAAADFNMRDAKAAVLFDPSFGVCAKLPDRTGLVSCETLPHRIAAENLRRRAVDEEMRVLYVAMTRARDRLIVCASVDDGKARLRAAQKEAGLYSEYNVRSTGNFLPWLLAPIAAGEECGVTVLTPDAHELHNIPRMTSDAALSCGTADAGHEATALKLRDIFRERFDFVYPYEHLKKIPSKLVVSRLYPGILDEEPTDKVLTDVILGDKAPLPRFMSGKSEADSAKIGTATHVFMQFCDFAALAGSGTAAGEAGPGMAASTDGGVPNSVAESLPAASKVRNHTTDGPADDKTNEAVARRIDAELARLVQKRFIAKNDADLVDRGQIAAFVTSTLFRRILSARQIWREFRFNAARSAADLTTDPALAEKLRSQCTDVIVQGVVDLLFEDADGRYILVDYKTDRLSAAQRHDVSLAKAVLRERHRNQLSYYRDILGDMLGQRIDEALIYSLTLADTVDID